MSSSRCSYQHWIKAFGEFSAPFRELYELYSTPKRPYHNLNHINHCLLLFDHTRRLFKNAPEAEAALWMHDVIYDISRHDNELKSAQWAVKTLSSMKFPAEFCDRVRRFIEATAGHHAFDSDSALLLDIDLSIFASGSENYRQYSEAIRGEYSFVPDSIYRQGRIKVLQNYLSRSNIYQSGHFQDIFEDKARNNILFEIELLNEAN